MVDLYVEMMNTSTPPHEIDFQLKSTFWLSVTAGSLILPFSIYHLSHQNIQTGVGAMIISLSLFFAAWHSHRKTYNSVYIFLLLTPFSTLYVAHLMSTVGISATYWCYPTVLLFYFIMSERQAWISNIFYVLINLPLAWYLFETHEAFRLSVTLILVSAYATIFLHVITRQYHELGQQAITDKLTGLYNRLLLQDSLEQAIHQTSRTNTAYTLIVMDIDHFKQINDELGHDVGDHVLMQLGAFLKDFFRSSDKVFRIGGEEFLILVYNTDETKSIDIAEKLRRGVENLSLIPDRTVTVSIGIAGLGSGKDWKQWMKACDKNLYEAKNGGRNRVVAC
ncbi:MAG: GGDEF domain-containing protein [Chromatiaceae bacterium]|nr:GGDEF domain-containing protein [Chromatiaceae bacterium]